MIRAFHYTDIEAQPVEGCAGVSIRWVMAQNVGAPHFAMRILELEPGASTEYHAHDWEHQVFVLAGECAVRDAQGNLTAVGPGSCVYVPPEQVHQFLNQGETPLRFICVIPFTPQE
ncbi:MAG: cupin domain-containing protein [Chloroflexi bacterium]|nr:cupin domain-containing protein [Chloroflexota bacterium]